MRLGIVAWNGQTGQLIVRDQRENGATLLFVCDPFGTGDLSGVSVSGEKTNGEENGFPWIESLQEQIAPDQRPFRLTVDTTGMPAAPAVFASEKFVNRAVHAADEGAREVFLSPENAGEWGYRPPPSPKR